MPDIVINDVTPRIQYTATGGQTVFPYPFAVFAQTDLKVYLTPVGSEPDDVADLLTLTTEYTVSGVGAAAGGNVTLVTGATAGDVVTIERDMPIERSTDFQLAGDFLAATLNNELDRVTMMIQQIETIFERRGLSFARSVDLQGVSLLLPKPSGSKVLAMNAGATELVWADIVALGVVATAFAQTLLDDPDAPTARATLGSTTVGDALFVAATKAAARAAMDVDFYTTEVTTASLAGGANEQQIITHGLGTDDVEVYVIAANNGAGVRSSWEAFIIRPDEKILSFRGNFAALSATLYTGGNAPASGNVRVDLINRSGISATITARIIVRRAIST